jgi:hypothetical protein
MEDILIPMLRGNMEDIGGPDASGSQDDGQGESASSQQAYERENRYLVLLRIKKVSHCNFSFIRIRIDYGSLRSQLKDLDDPDDKKKLESNLGKKLNECISNIQRINAPNLKVICD